MRRARLSLGFSLVEALVALLISAGVLGGFYTALSTGKLLERRAELSGRQALVAHSVLDQVGVDIALRDGATLSGEMNGLAWQMAITSQPEPDLVRHAVELGALLYVKILVAAEQEGDAPLILRSVRYPGAPL